MKTDHSKKLRGRVIVVGLLLCLSTAAFLYTSTHRNEAEPYAPASIEAESDLVKNHSYWGFELMNAEFSSDMNAWVYQFIHEKTGGKLIYVANEDQNKWFSIAFRTPAVDNTGVNHIIEHTVLEGSGKYNFKGAFTEISKRSVYTFMNAYTSSDQTLYPIASENDQDFQNLMSYYLDAVFDPVVVKNDKLLMQEGWRYQVDGSAGDIGFNGVVFNEMKGALSDRYDTIYTQLPSLVYPDTKYRFNSGGNPMDIVDLTHAHLVDTYQKYYTPSNACIVLYGKMDVKEKLQFISEGYYDKYTQKGEIDDPKVQEPFPSPKTFTLQYPAEPGATSENDSILTWNLALSNTDVNDRLGLELLAILLTESNSSDLYLNTVDQDMGQYVSAELDPTYFQPLFTIMLEGANSLDREKFDAAVQKSLGDIARKGFDKREIKAVINSYRLDFKTALLSADKGGNAVDSVSNGFVTHGDPLLLLNQSKTLEAIEAETLKGRYFENLITKYLIDNPHQVSAVFEPAKDYMAGMDTEINQKLQGRLMKMSPEEVNTLKAGSAQYEAWQQLPAVQEALDALPTLEISQLNLKPHRLAPVENTLAGTSMYAYPCDTRGLTRLNLYFDMGTLTQKELSYLDLFSRVLERADTKSYDNTLFTSLLQESTSGLTYTPLFLEDGKDPSQIHGYYQVSTVFESQQSSTAAKLMKEVFLKARLNNRSLIEDTLSELVAELEDEKVNAPADTAYSRIGASLSKAGALYDNRYEEGLKTLSGDEKDFETAYPEIRKTLQSIYRKVFNRRNLKWSIVSDETGIAACEKSMIPLLKALKDQELPSAVWDIEVKKQRTALMAPSEMQTIYEGFSMKQTSTPVSGQDLVFAQLLSEGYMYENIRLKGGAYGGSFTLDPDGTALFETYSDPNLPESVATIRNVPAYLNGYRPKPTDIANAITAVAGGMALGKDLFDETEDEDLRRLSNGDPRLEENLLREALGTTLQDLPAFTEKIEAGLQDSSLVVAGSESQILKNKALFDTLKYIQE